MSMSNGMMMQKFDYREVTNNDVALWLGYTVKKVLVKHSMSGDAMEDEWRNPEGKYIGAHIGNEPNWLGNTDDALSLVPDTFDFYIERSHPSGNWRFYKHEKNGNFEMMSLCTSSMWAIVKAMVKLKEFQNEK